MYNGHNNEWEYVEQISSSQSYENEYHEENGDNMDDLYESHFIEEEFEYDYDTNYSGGENDNCQSFPKEPQFESELPSYFLPPRLQSAPGYIPHQNHNSLLESPRYDVDYTENENFPKSTTIKFLNCTNDCGSEGLEELVDSNDYETLVLFANYNTRNLKFGPKEYYSSESDEEILEFVESAINKRKRRTKKGYNRYDRPKSGHSLTTRHKGRYSFPSPRDEDVKFKNLDLDGFGQAEVMRPILTLKEQQMLGIRINLNPMDSNLLKNPMGSQTPNKRRDRTKNRTRKVADPSTTNIFPSHVPEHGKFNIGTFNNSSTTVENLRKHDAILRIESIKVAAFCEDPAAAGDSAEIDKQNKSPRDIPGSGRRPKYDVENCEIISATHSFKQAVLLHLPQQPQFTLGDKLSVPSVSTEAKGLKKGMEQQNKYKLENRSKRRLLSDPDKLLGGTKKYAKDAKIPGASSLPSMNLHKSYKSPIPPRRLSSPIRHVLPTNCSPHSWQTVGHKIPDCTEIEKEEEEKFKLSLQFKESCANLWSHRLQSCPSLEDEPLPPLPSRTQSETKCRGNGKTDLTAEKKIQFTYTSNESFFVTTAEPNDAEPLRNFQASKSNSGSANSSTTFIKTCPVALESNSQESQGTFTICSSREDLVSPISSFDVDDTENCSSTDGKSTSSSRSSLNFIVFPKTPYSSRSALDSLPHPPTTPAGDIFTIYPLPLDSTSYTTLELLPSSGSSTTEKPNSPRSFSHASIPRTSSKEHSDDSVGNPFSESTSDASDTSFTNLETPPHHSSNSSDSDDAPEEANNGFCNSGTNDGFCNGVTMTDKMGFKFVLDENGSEVQISVTLPFPVPSSELPNIESPYVAAAVLQRARELVLQNANFKGTGGCGCGDFMYYGGKYGSFHSPRPCSEWVEHCTESDLPTLECSISMEELLHGSTSRNININENQEGDKLVSRSGVGDIESESAESCGQHHTKNSNRFIRFFSYLFLCRWCRNENTIFPENTKKPDCDTKDNKI